MPRKRNKVGVFIQEELFANPTQKNREIGKKVLQHFPEDNLDFKKVCQRIANTKYLKKKNMEVANV